MVIMWALSWWYGAGWKAEMMKLRERLDVSYDYFSIGLLARTLFSPYKQISAGNVGGPIGLRVRAFADRLISRVIGAAVRSIFIIVGIGWLTIQTIFGGVWLATWGFIPVVPFIGFIVMLSGIVPIWS